MRGDIFTLRTSLRSSCTLPGIVGSDGRKEGNADAELKAYDALGMEYYYMGNVVKAKYYHGRMANRDIEGSTPEKLSSLKWVVDRRKELRKKHILQFKTCFELFQAYNIDPNVRYVFPHEDRKCLEKYHRA